MNTTSIPMPEEQKTAHAEEYLNRKAGKVEQEDIDNLSSSIPEKLAGIKDLRGGVEWLEKIVGQVQVLFDMIKDREFGLNKKSTVLVAAALIYFVLPTDMTPDFIPGIGYLDDAMVLASVWKLLTNEIERFTEFRRTRGLPSERMNGSASEAG